MRGGTENIVSSWTGEPSADVAAALSSSRTDEMVFALFAAASPDIVARTCGRAGIPPERLTLAADLVVPGEDPADEDTTV